MGKCYFFLKAWLIGNCFIKSRAISTVRHEHFSANHYVYLPKQFPLWGINILQAVAMGSSTDIMVLIITSSIFIIKAERKKKTF